MVNLSLELQKSKIQNPRSEILREENLNGKVVYSLSLIHRATYANNFTLSYLLETFKIDFISFKKEFIVEFHQCLSTIKERTLLLK